jgi:hypothetical protein
MAVNLDIVFSRLFSTLTEDNLTTSIGDFNLSVGSSKPSKVVMCTACLQAMGQTRPKSQLDHSFGLAWDPGKLKLLAQATAFKQIFWSLGGFEKQFYKFNSAHKLFLDMSKILHSMPLAQQLLNNG